LICSFIYTQLYTSVATGVAPWVQRASDMKAEVVMNHDMERKLQQHSDEIVKLIKDVKFKVIKLYVHPRHTIVTFG
jgi:hypothetical protein